MNWESSARFGGGGSGTNTPPTPARSPASNLHSNPQLCRPRVQAALRLPRALVVLAMSASARSRAWARGAQRRGEELGTHRRSRKQVYSYSNKRTNCTRRGEGASNRRARGSGAALHKAIFCVGASGAFACCGVISGFEKRTVARPHFPLWFRRRRKCFAGG